MFSKKGITKKRFSVIHQEGTYKDGFLRILQDNETGVQYLYYSPLKEGGITPLLDSEGKPTIIKTENKG